MSGARRRSKSSWDNKEDFDSTFHQSPKHSNSEANDILMYDDFSMQPNENNPYRGDNNRGPRNRDRSRSRNRDRERRESRFRDDRNRDSDAYRKDEGDYNNHRGYNSNRNNDEFNDQDHRRSSSQNVKPPCRFFMRGDCNRNRCKFSHDVQKSEGIEGNSHDHDDYNNNRPCPQNLDEKNKSWNDLESGSFHNNIGNQDFSQNMSLTFNGDEKSPDMNGSNDVFLHMEIKKETDNIHNESGKLLEGSRNYIPNKAVSFPEKQDVFLHMEIKKETDNIHQESGKLLEASRNDIPNETVSFPEKQILANALELLYSLPNSTSEAVKTSVVNTGIVDSGEERNQKPVELVEVKKEEKSKIEGQGKVEEGDEKAMRQFKNALVEFVKEILKPTWKEGKMSREVYKTIVKKVVEKVSSSIQGVQIPRTQEKIDQYLAFSKSKITKLVEAYVGRLQKA